MTTIQYTVQDQINRELEGSAMAQKKFWEETAHNMSAGNTHMTAAGRELIKLLTPRVEARVATRTAQLALHNTTLLRHNILMAAGVEEVSAFLVKTLIRNVGQKLTATAITAGSAITAMAAQNLASKDKAKAPFINYLVRKVMQKSSDDLRLAKDIKEEIDAALRGESKSQILRDAIGDKELWVKIGVDMLSVAAEV